MEKQKKNDNNSGITLVALVVSIVVMLILAGVSINAIVGNNGILTQAQNAVLSQTLATYKEEWEYKLVQLSISEGSTSIYAINENVKNYIESLDDNDVGKIAIYDGSLVYLSTSTSETEVATNLGYITMSDDDYNYMLELTLIENAILAIEANGDAKVGVELGTVNYTYVTIAGINYGYNWYIIGSDESNFSTELAELGITDTEIMIHYPYIVQYTTGAVQSTVGKMMYAGTDTEIWKYTFNYYGEDGGLVVSNLLNAVSSDSTKTETTFGSMTIKTSSSYTDTFTYDDDGGLIMTKTTGVPLLYVSEETNIANTCSMSVTIKTDMSLSQLGAIISISNVGNMYTSVLGSKGHNLTFYNYWTSTSAGYTFGAAEESSTYGQRTTGCGVIDMSEFDGKYLNITATAEKGGEAKVYLNGKLVLSFEAGNEEFEFAYITIGDLRPGRNMKFIGTVYNYALYGSVLTDSEVAQNWQYIQTDLGIDENGDKVN